MVVRSRQASAFDEDFGFPGVEFAGPGAVLEGDFFSPVRTSCHLAIVRSRDGVVVVMAIAEVGDDDNFFAGIIPADVGEDAVFFVFEEVVEFVALQGEVFAAEVDEAFVVFAELLVVLVFEEGPVDLFGVGGFGVVVGELFAHPDHGDADGGEDEGGGELGAAEGVFIEDQRLGHVGHEAEVVVVGGVVDDLGAKVREALKAGLENAFHALEIEVAFGDGFIGDGPEEGVVPTGVHGFSAVGGGRQSSVFSGRYSAML